MLLHICYVAHLVSCRIFFINLLAGTIYNNCNIFSLHYCLILPFLHCLYSWYSIVPFCDCHYHCCRFCWAYNYCRLGMLVGRYLTTSWYWTLKYVSVKMGCESSLLTSSFLFISRLLVVFPLAIYNFLVNLMIDGFTTHEVVFPSAFVPCNARRRASHLTLKS